ncbi:UPF0565 protein C2orf69 homolog [Bradysia coprophila]|uniref:UPF0565 protein C2orf69 homolog n=1 Tax=Bradysia coprophila TaxID=38358 RepID=UPI00187DA5DE|nr:UPF0565 protein C2orf69 homolog [Bradysia coprophila]XP_037047801.1 UPF0565 protein C2orf69 homolog [Bradysia coprophila]
MLGGTTTTGRIGAQNTVPIRLRAVSGFQNRLNDVVYCPPLIKQDDEPPTSVVYFGGDVQDFSENMETNRDSKSYMKYNLESTALLLRNGFPKSHIIVIRPARMEFKTFSCFDNFVRGNSAGVPDHTPMHHSLQHLEKLLQSISQRLLNMNQVPSTSGTSTNLETNQEIDIDILQVQETVTVDTDGEIEFSCKDGNSSCNSISTADLTTELLQNDIQTTIASPSTSEVVELLDPMWRENLNLEKCKLILVGFSKGCVVLNQFIYEFHYLKTLTPDDSTMIRLLSRIKEMYWLDGGHGGAKNTWITSRSLLETLTRLGINIYVHVTPYQVQDDRRPWIRKEEKSFTDLLRRLGANLTRCLHFDTSAVANLYTHFEVLQVFRQPCPTQQPVHISPLKDDDEEK